MDRRWWGLGPVFKAPDTVTGPTVFCKDAGDALKRAKLLADAKAAASVSHAKIATLFEVGDGEELLCLVFEFTPGDTLDKALNGKPFEVRRAVEMAVQLVQVRYGYRSQPRSHLAQSIRKCRRK